MKQKNLLYSCAECVSVILTLREIMRLLFLSVLFIAFNGNAQTLCERAAGGGCDWSKPFLVQEGNTVYKTVPGTSQRDWMAGHYVSENGAMRFKDTNGITRYDEPGIVIEGTRVYQTNANGIDYVAEEKNRYSKPTYIFKK